MKWIEEDMLLVREFVFKNFKSAIDFVNKIAKISEKFGHHPNILVYDYNKVRVTLTTHSEGKITEKDRELAREIDKL